MTNSPPIVARAMAGPALGVNVQAAMRGQGIGKGPLRPDAADLPAETSVRAAGT